MTMIDSILCCCTVSRRSPTPAFLSGGLLAVGLALWAASPRTGWGVLLQLTGAFAVTAGLYVAIRWLARGYTYTLEQHDSGRIDFVVTEKNGRRQTTVCCISTEDIWDLHTPAPKERPPKGCRIYHYCADLRPRNACLLTVCEGEETVILRFTPDAAFHAALALLVPSKKDADLRD